MEKAFSEIYGAVRLVAVADPEISNHKRLICFPFCNDSAADLSPAVLNNFTVSRLAFMILW